MACTVFTTIAFFCKYAMEMWSLFEKAKTTNELKTLQYLYAYSVSIFFRGYKPVLQSRAVHTSGLLGEHTSYKHGGLYG